MDRKRDELLEAHRAHLAAQGVKLLASGALLGDDGNHIEGGASLLDTEDFKEAVRFETQDPYAKAGIRARVEKSSNGDCDGGSVNSRQRGTPAGRQHLPYRCRTCCLRANENLSAPATSDLSWLTPTPHATAVYASFSASLPPHATLAARRLARPYLGRTFTG